MDAFRKPKGKPLGTDSPSQGMRCKAKDHPEGHGLNPLRAVRPLARLQSARQTSRSYNRRGRPRAFYACAEGTLRRTPSASGHLRLNCGRSVSMHRCIVLRAHRPVMTEREVSRPNCKCARGWKALNGFSLCLSG